VSVVLSGSGVLPRAACLCVILKLKDNKIVSGLSQTHSMFYFYLDDMLRSIDHHQVIFTKLRIRRMQCK